MAGEMSQSEVTRESYPLLFALRDALKRRGIKSEPRAFDQYQGPYLRVEGGYKVWYSSEDIMGEFLLIEKGAPPCNDFEISGAEHVFKETESTLQYGVYTLRQAAERIGELAK